MKEPEQDLYDYSKWPDFTKKELTCRVTGKENPNVEAFTDLMNSVQELRTLLGFVFVVNSAYRSPEHPIEAVKIAKGLRGGMHTYAAIDIKVPVEHCYRFVQEAMKMGFTGIGINLKGDHGQRFIHLDKRIKNPRIWSY